MSKTEFGCLPKKRSRYKVLNFEVDFLKTEVFQIEQNGSQATFSLTRDLDSELDLISVLTCYYLIPGGFHRTFATGAVSQKRKFTPPDTGSCPIWDLHLFLCSDHSFLNLSCLRTFWVSNSHRYFFFAHTNSSITNSTQIHSYVSTLSNKKNTVDVLIFMGYQFLWFPWRVWSTNSSTNEIAIFCMNNEGKYYDHDFWTPRMCHVCSIHENWYPRK